MMNIASLLCRGANKAGNAPAVAYGTKITLLFSALVKRVRVIAGAMRGHGVRKGDRILLFMSNRCEYVELMFASWWCGAAIVPVNSKLVAAEVSIIVNKVMPKLIFSCPNTTGKLGEIGQIDVASDGYMQFLDAAPASAEPVHVEEDDLAWLFFTSGTTGIPKGAMITHRNLMAMTKGYMTNVDTIPNGAALIHFAPMSHGSGFYILPFIAQGGVSVVPSATRFDTEEFVELTSYWQTSCLFAAPTMVRRLTQEVNRDALVNSRLRTIVYGGGPLFIEDLKSATRVFGPVFAQIYGQGECPMSITAQRRDAFSRALARDDDDFLATVGWPFLGAEVMIANKAGMPLRQGEIGEVLVRSDTVFKGYWNDPDATRDTLTDGWLTTGDTGRLNEDGTLSLVGRSKETIITGGSNVYPIEVENVLVKHPKVNEVAVMGLPDPEWGEIVTAFVVAAGKSDGLEQELDVLCRQYIAPYKRPRKYFLRADLPKNAYGKIEKKALVR